MSPGSASEPTRSRIKSSIRSLITDNDPILSSGRNTLTYRLRKHLGWPSSVSPQIQVVLLNMQEAGTIRLTDRKGRPLSKVNLTRTEKSAERLVIVPVKKAKTPAPDSSKSHFKSKDRSQWPMPAPVRIIKPAPDAREVLDMIRLELMLTFKAMFEHPTDAEIVIYDLLGLKFEGSRAIIEEAVDLGYVEGCLDVFPRTGSSYQKIMIREVPTEDTVDKLRATYGWLAAGRRWPPPASQ